MKYIILLAFSILFVSSCKSDPSTDTTQQVADTTVVTSSDPAVLNTLKLLEGTWNSRDDKNTAITFKGNTRQETRDGKALGKMRYFEIADQCNNDASKGEKNVKVKAKYLSMLDIDMCYYIKKLNKRELVLSYLGRKDDLRYIKAH